MSTISALNAHSNPLSAILDPNQSSRCSQCKQSRTLNHFPVRLSSLQPYLVCKSHSWYWTEEKKETYWAPEYSSTIEDVCEQIQEALKLASQEGASLEDTVVIGAWIVGGDKNNQAELVQEITRAGEWGTDRLAQRASRSKKSNPPPTPSNYLLRHKRYKTAPLLRLTLTHHAALEKWVIILKEDTPRLTGVWAEEKKARAAASAVVSMSDTPLNDSNSTSTAGQNGSSPKSKSSKQLGRPGKRKQKQKENDNLENTTPGHHSAADSTNARSDVDQRTYDMIKTLEAAIGPEATALAMGHQQSGGSEGNTSKKPAKRLKLSSSSLSSGLPRPSRSALVSAAGQLAPRAAFAPLLTSGQDSSESSAIASGLNPTSRPIASTSTALFPPNTVSRLYPNRLTLDELLDSPFTDPPMIPLTKRVFQHHPHDQNGTAVNQKAPAVKGRVRFVNDDEVTPSSDAIGPDEDDDEEEEELLPDEDDEDAFEEDSCEDDSEGDEGDFGSSEEGDDDDDDEEEEEEEGEEGEDGDWLTGFVKGQLMHSGQEEVDELEEDANTNEGVKVTSQGVTT